MDALLAGTPVVRSVEESYDLCQKLATTHYENFTVGSWFLPRGKRKHFYAIYAFCRSVDDLGDEYPGDRMRALDMWEQEVRSCFRDTPKHPEQGAGSGSVHWGTRSRACGLCGR